MRLLKDDFIYFALVFESLPRSFTCQTFFEKAQKTYSRCINYVKNYLFTNHIVTKAGTIYTKEFDSVAAFFTHSCEIGTEGKIFEQYMNMGLVEAIYRQNRQSINKESIRIAFPELKPAYINSELEKLEQLGIITISQNKQFIVPIHHAFKDWVLFFSERFTTKHESTRKT